MELKFMTPTEVWEGFDPNVEPLEASIISTEVSDNIACTTQLFTAETTQQGKLRACCNIYFDTRWDCAHSALLMLPSTSDFEDLQTVHRLVQDGHVVCMLDYCGVMSGQTKTTFPADLSFAQYPNSQGFLDTIDKSARKSPWFVWAKIARRAISVLQTLSIVDATKIAVIGFGLGAKFAWQVAGMDRRVRALVSINGGGYRWALNHPRFTEGNVPTNDEQRAFSTGVGAETYAHLVTCPTLFITSRSSKHNDVDRAFDMVDLVRSNSKQLIITCASGNQITNKEFDALLLWLNHNLANEELPYVNPSIRFEVAEGKLYVRLNSNFASNTKKLFVSYGEPQSRNRFWQVNHLEQKVGSHEYICNIPVFDKNELIVAYATFEYVDGNVISTKVVGIIPSKLDNNIVEEKYNEYSSRIIYDGSMGIGSFTSKTDSAILDEHNIFVAKGPFNIDGITVQDGDLLLCRGVHENLSNMSTLHIDAFSPTERQLAVSVYVYPDMKKYTAKTKLAGGEFWQRILLENLDFKSEEGRTLQSFKSTKVISFENLCGVVLNNMLWI